MKRTIDNQGRNKKLDYDGTIGSPSKIEARLEKLVWEKKMRNSIISWKKSSH